MKQLIKLQYMTVSHSPQHALDSLNYWTYSKVNTSTQLKNTYTVIHWYTISTSIKWYLIRFVLSISYHVHLRLNSDTIVWQSTMNNHTQNRLCSKNSTKCIFNLYIKHTILTFKRKLFHFRHKNKQFRNLSVLLIKKN